MNYTCIEKQLSFIHPSPFFSFFQWDVMTDKEACDIVWAAIRGFLQAQGTEPGNASPAGLPTSRSALVALAGTAAEALVQASLRAGTMDNVTAVVGMMPWE
jgi:hypothetical protein